ncbi:MAG: helix-turn-helix domain-containing protein [Candidatus Lokiarchaeota archaeon]|nr:helix-turn-helix domain-containing protein [Candidatus Lokiarchaeota archaeon]
MIKTIRFRLHPTTSQEQKLHKVFTIYNKIKRIGYNHYFKLIEVNDWHKFWNFIEITNIL